MDNIDYNEYQQNDVADMYNPSNTVKNILLTFVLLCTLTIVCHSVLSQIQVQSIKSEFIQYNSTIEEFAVQTESMGDTTRAALMRKLKLPMNILNERIIYFDNLFSYEYSDFFVYTVPERNFSAFLQWKKIKGIK